MSNIIKYFYNINKILLLYLKHKLFTFIFYDLFNFSQSNFTKQKNSQLINQLDRNGFYVIENYLERNKCLESLNVYKDNFAKYSQFVHHGQDKRIYGIEKVNKSSHKFFEDENLLKIGNYVNKENSYCAFTLLNWLEDGNNGSSGEGWHRDSFLSQYKTILYLTDVNTNSGPFQIIPKSHKLINILKLMLFGDLDYLQTRYSNNEINKFQKLLNSKTITITAKAGTLIIFNSSTIHRGKPIKKGERMALTNYYFPVSRAYKKLVKKFKPIV